MKYWNKSKRGREAWTKIKRPTVWTDSRAPSTSMWAGARVAFPELQREDEMKLWCQRHPSKGKFYYRHGSPTWWFENKEDAVLFVMRWS